MLADRQGPARARRAGAPDVVIALGTTLRAALAAAAALAEEGVAAAVLDARFVKPLDEGLIAGEAERARRVVTVEESCLAGGFGAACLERFERRGLVADGLRVGRLGLPDEFVTHGDAARQRAALGLDAAGIARACRELVGERAKRGGGLRGAPARAGRAGMPRRQRIDVLLVERGLAESRAKAQALVMAGAVVAGEARVDKPGALVDPEAPIRLKEGAAPQRYVSRGALKLEKALDVFPIDPAGKLCADLGASTGGFTDLLLQRGAARVFAIDVGYGQLHPKLRGDPRVVVRERENARALDRRGARRPGSIS